MAEQRGRDISALFSDIFNRRQGITSADTLWELARRTPEGRRLRVTLALAREWMKDEGRGQVYKQVPQQWPGKFNAPHGQIAILIWTV